MTGKSKIRSNIRNQNSRIKKKKSFQNRSIDSIIFSHGLAKRGERSGRAVTPRYEITYLIVVGKRFIEIESDGERSRTYTEYCMVNAPRTGQLRLLRPTWGERRKVNPRGINGETLGGNANPAQRWCNRSECSSNCFSNGPRNYNAIYDRRFITKSTISADVFSNLFRHIVLATY